MPPSIYSQQLLLTVDRKDITFQIPLNPPFEKGDNIGLRLVGPTARRGNFYSNSLQWVIPSSGGFSYTISIVPEEELKYLISTSPSGSIRIAGG